MLENIRFNRGEETNDIEFSKKLSSLGDIYVNDAFSCSHRSHSSVDGITKYIPSYYGLQITQEILALKKITSEIKNPVSHIIGGSKISTKINIINNLAKKGEVLLKGQFISSGSCTKPSKIYSGNHIKARFEQLEDIEFQFI